MLLPNLSEFGVIPQPVTECSPQPSKPILMAEIINLNTASAKELTQLPGVAKNVA